MTGVHDLDAYLHSQLLLAVRLLSWLSIETADEFILGAHPITHYTGSAGDTHHQNLPLTPRPERGYAPISAGDFLQQPTFFLYY